MNKPIRRVFWVVVALFALLAFYTARWTVIDAKSLRQNSLNQIPTIRGLKKPRGSILAASGSTIARSVKIGGGGDAFYSRRYPLGSLFGHPGGYSYARRGSAGLEKYYDDRLTGRTVAVTSVLDSLLGRGGDEQTMVTNLDRGTQQLAESEMQGRKGAIVVIDPKTGQVPVYVSIPPYNPSLMRTDAGFNVLNKDSNSPLFDRVSGAGYPPGSTFKVIAATAALDTGVLKPDSLVDGDSPKTFSGKPLQNDFNTSFGQITLTHALVQSVNTVFGQIGVDLGKDTLTEYMKRYGFYSPPPVDMPGDALLSSGVYNSNTNRLLPPDAPVDLARVAIGQERLKVTPIQMAEVASTVANGGVRVAPRIAHTFEDRYGRVKKTIGTTTVRRVMSEQTAKELNVMMRDVVEEGTGNPANIAGLNLAGKTGTAEVPGGNQAWFIGFAPAEKPRYAIAVTIEKTDGFGGTVAAPIAASVLKDLLQKDGG
ncbi:MAG: peptidoglycan D,D-transpeptidase FtsI family protein [Solirubrobacterales bacterium]